MSYEKSVYKNAYKKYYKKQSYTKISYPAITVGSRFDRYAPVFSKYAKKARFFLEQSNFS